MSLITALSDPTRRSIVIADAIKELEAELDERSGLTNVAVKTGYKAVQKAKPGIIAHALEDLITKFAPILDSHHDVARVGGGEVEKHFVDNGKVIAHDLLGVTDARMSQSSNKVAKTFYEKLRPRATDQVVDGMPRLARLVAKHS